MRVLLSSSCLTLSSASSRRRLLESPLVWLAGGLVLLAAVRLLPAEGVGLALRLAVPAALVLLVPGALVVVRLGSPSGIAALPAALAWSLAILFAALVFTFLVGGSLNVTLGVLAVVTLALALLPGRRKLRCPARSEWIAPVAVALAGFLLSVAVWLAAGPLRGDALFHLARARKLAELPGLDSLRALSEFPDGGVHPGYAVPLWHAVLALVGRLGGVDVADVVLHLSAVLTPLALLLAYAAGAVLFGSRVGGVATALAQVGVVQLAGEHVSSFKLLSLPVAASLLLVVPALLALVFAFVASGERRILLPIAAAALALAVIHPTYALFVLLPLGGFLGARLLLRRATTDPPRIALAMGAAAAAAGTFLLWLLPIANDTDSYTPGERRRAQELFYYTDRLDVSGDSFRIDPAFLAAGGIAVVVALVAVPIALLAWRSRWAAYVVGGAVPVLLIALVPALFSRFADLVSLSQALRIRHFLPLAFALAGAALLGAAFLRRWVRYELAGLAIVLAVVLPSIAVRVAGLERTDRPDPLPAGLVQALESRAEPRDLVVSDPVTSYRLAAYVPVTILAAPLAHVAQTPDDRPYDRLREVDRLVAADATERRRLLKASGARWLVVDRSWGGGDLSAPGLEPVYDDGRFGLYVLPSP
jgi:hypothetical protein